MMANEIDNRMIRVEVRERDIGNSFVGEEHRF
jgi:hypothetical protein